MRWLFFAVLVVHGLIHVMGFAKAFRLAELPQLTTPIGRGMGLVWLVAGLATLTAAAMLVLAPRWWWVLGAAALVLSQIAIVASWDDARFGTFANALLLVGAVYGVFSQGPTSLRAEYAARVATELARPATEGLVTEADLARLPEPVARYVRVTGSVGQPRVSNFRATMRGRIRASASAAWMEFTSEQLNRLGPEPSRLFFLDATMKHLPVDVLHLYVGRSATMRVRLLSVLQLVEAHGPELDQAETVTLLNDLCIFAPAALVDPALRWEPVDAARARVRFTNGRHTVGAELVFDEAGQLVDFVSDDRYRASEDGEGFALQRWSTPISAYRDFGARRIATRGEARYHAPAPEGEFAYLELEVLDIAYNVAAR